MSDSQESIGYDGAEMRPRSVAVRCGRGGRPTSAGRSDRRFGPGGARSPWTAAAAAVAVVALLSGCAGSAAGGASLDPGDTTAASPSAGSSAPPSSSGPEASPSAVADTDTVLTVATTARASGGEELDLDIRVSRSFPADAPEVADLREVLLAECGSGFLDAAQLDAEGWGLVRVSVTATEREAGTWPDGTVLSLVTAGQEGTDRAALASTGSMLAPLEDVAGESGPCLTPRGIAGPGEGEFVFGLGHDFASESLSGVFWATDRYGVSAIQHLEAGDRAVAEIVECAVIKTPLGEELAAPEIGYGVIDDGMECSAGRPSPTF